MSNFILGLFVAWFGKRAIAVMDWVFDLAWGWYRASPELRCYATMAVYTSFMNGVCRQIERGKITDRKQLEMIREMNDWMLTRLRTWEDRVRQPAS